ncbi:ABC transporter ATP-binding protein [Candidatus Margulisiibacteriota bacterium]
MSPLLKVTNLSGGYGKETIIKDISFEVQKGEFVAVIGPNGSGKSTLLRLLSRVLLPQQGQVLFENIDIARFSRKELSKINAFVPQDTLVNFAFSVQEIVMMGRIPHLNRLQIESKKDYEITRHCLELTGSLPLKDKMVDQLSAGERQRVIISKALAQEPVLLFLDEPTSHLDIGYQIQILDLLKKLNRETQLTIIIVLHDLNLASEYCHRMIMLNDGSLFQDGAPEGVLTYDNIEEVYKTVVVINKNPVSGKPNMSLIPWEYLNMENSEAGSQNSGQVVPEL